MYASLSCGGVVVAVEINSLWLKQGTACIVFITSSGDSVLFLGGTLREGVQWGPV